MSKCDKITMYKNNAVWCYYILAQSVEIIMILIGFLNDNRLIVDFHTLNSTLN